jgi:hypothetical protein
MDNWFTPSDYGLHPRREPSYGLPHLSQPIPATRLRHLVLRGDLRSRRDLPFYCNPVALFFAVWSLMLACLCLHVSYATYPSFGTPLLIFSVSACALLLGYAASAAVFENDAALDERASYGLDVTLLWRINLLLCVIAVLVVVANWATDGPPPALGDPTTYLTYGRLKQILFPFLSTVAVNSTFDTSRLRRFVFLAFSISILILYITRGALLTTFLEMFFVFSMRTSMSKRKLYFLSLGSFAFALTAVTVFGNLRTAHDVFITYLQIRDKFADLPMAWLWFVSYFSVPLSNLCWIVAHPAAHGPTLAFLYPLLPTFMAPVDPYTQVYTSTNIIDNGSTYLQAYALDFSYLGIYFANLILGVGCRWFVARSYPKYILVLAIFLTAMSFIFIDMFLVLTTILQAVLQFYISKCCFYWNEYHSAPARP